jgi:hypothetical protein
MWELSQAGHHGLDLLDCGCPAVTEISQQFRNHEQKLLVQLLEQGAAAGELAVEQPEQIACVLLQIYDCFGPFSGRTATLATMRASLPVCHSLVFDGLLRR